MNKANNDLRQTLRHAFQHIDLLTDWEVELLGKLWQYPTKGWRLTDENRRMLDRALVKIEANNSAHLETSHVTS